MTKFPLGAVCILENQKLIGIITDGDLRRTLLETDDINKVSVGDIMSKNPKTISPEESLGFALDLMEKRKPTPVSLLPVVCPENQNFLGLIRLHDILA